MNLLLLSCFVATLPFSLGSPALSRWDEVAVSKVVAPTGHGRRLGASGVDTWENAKAQGRVGPLKVYFDFSAVDEHLKGQHNEMCTAAAATAGESVTPSKATKENNEIVTCECLQ